MTTIQGPQTFKHKQDHKSRRSKRGLVPSGIREESGALVPDRLGLKGSQRVFTATVAKPRQARLTGRALCSILVWFRLVHSSLLYSTLFTFILSYCILLFYFILLYFIYFVLFYLTLNNSGDPSHPHARKGSDFCHTSPWRAWAGLRLPPKKVTAPRDDSPFMGENILQVKC